MTPRKSLRIPLLFYFLIFPFPLLCLAGGITIAEKVCTANAEAPKNVFVIVIGTSYSTIAAAISTYNFQALKTSGTALLYSSFGISSKKIMHLEDFIN
jgi:hypothetical protein